MMRCGRKISASTPLLRSMCSKQVWTQIRGVDAESSPTPLTSAYDFGYSERYDLPATRREMTPEQYKAEYRADVALAAQQLLNMVVLKILTLDADLREAARVLAEEMSQDEIALQLNQLNAAVEKCEEQIRQNVAELKRVVNKLALAESSPTPDDDTELS